jgi:hypothetical protein
MIHPDHKQIELRAYQLWQERGEPIGTPEEDWFKAELELIQPEGILSRVAREVGSPLGTATAFLHELGPGKLA